MNQLVRENLYYGENDSANSTYTYAYDSSVNKVSLDKLTKISFRHYRVRNIESRKFSLFGFYSVHKIEVNIVNYPFIKRSLLHSVTLTLITKRRLIGSE